MYLLNSNELYIFSNSVLLTLTALVQDSLGIEIEFNETTEEILFRSTQQNTGEPIDFFNGFKT